MYASLLYKSTVNLISRNDHLRNSYSCLDKPMRTQMHIYLPGRSAVPISFLSSRSDPKTHCRCDGSKGDRNDTADPSGLRMIVQSTGSHLPRNQQLA